MARRFTIYKPGQLNIWYILDADTGAYLKQPKKGTAVSYRSEEAARKAIKSAKAKEWL